MHAHHTGVELIGSVKCTFSHEAVCHRSLNLMGKGLKLICRIRNHRAAACKDERFFRISDQIKCLFHVLFADCGILAHNRLGSLVLVITGIGSNVLRNIN